MRRIAREEGRHAELAWEVIRWAVGEVPTLRELLLDEVARESRPELVEVEDGIRFGRASASSVEDAHRAAVSEGRSRVRRLL